MAEGRSAQVDQVELSTRHNVITVGTFGLVNKYYLNFASLYWQDIEQLKLATARTVVLTGETDV